MLRIPESMFNKKRTSKQQEVRFKKADDVIIA